jgi:hypothetical protein
MPPASLFRRNHHFIEINSAAPPAAPSKDKTFVLGDFEPIRQVQDLKSVQLVVPSPVARGSGQMGSRRSPLSTGPRFRPAVLMPLRIRTCFFPLPNLPNSVNGDTGLFATSPVHQFAQNYATARLEHGPGDDDLL